MELNRVRNIRFRAFLAAAAIGSFSAVFAHTEVHEMGVAPLLGVTSSTPELREKFAEHPEIVREAAKKIGLSSAEYHAFLEKFNNEKPYWGQVPRHLDAMSWAAGGQVYAIHDVTIPAGVNGWEVDLRERHQIVAIYIPMICANLSVVRRPIHEVSARPPLPAPFVPPAPAAPAPVPLVAAEVPPAQAIPPVAPQAIAHHPHLFWPILAAAVAGVIIASDHHGSSSTPPAPVGSVISAPGGSAGGGSFVPVSPPHHCGCENSGGSSSSGW